MVNITSLLSIGVALAISVGIIFVINNFILKREFDIQSTIINIVVVGIVLTIAGMITPKIVGRKGIEPPKVNI